jgi:small subunit ribosomal protein S8
MINDHVSDMLTRFRNATLAKHSFVRVSYSKLNIAILKVLKTEGFIENYTLENLSNVIAKPYWIKVFLKYKGWWVKKPFFTSLQRISKPGKRIFSGYKTFDKKIDVLKYRQGIALISTSSGVMSHRKAQKLKKGGEILCYIG